MGKIIAGLILLTSIMGSILGVPFLTATSFILIIFSILIIGLNKNEIPIEEKEYPLLVWTCSLGMLFSTTLLTSYLVGTDIHFEYYISNKALSGWDPNYPHPFNSSIALTIIAPVLSRFINLYWVFKVIFPLVFSLTPFIMYNVFSTFLSKKIAFLSCIFIIIIPSFFLEITGLAKTQFAEPLLALMFVSLLGNIINKKLVLGLVVEIFLATLFHYTMGIICLLYLVMFFGYSLILRKWVPIKVKLRYILLVLIIAGVLSIGYLTLVARGTSSTVILEIGKSLLGMSTSGKANPPPSGINSTSEIWVPGFPTEKEIPIAGDGTPPRVAVRNPFDIRNQTELIKLALGIFLQYTTKEGFAFWITQIGIQLVLVIGFFYLVRKRKEYPGEYIILVLCSFTLLALNLLVPGVASMLNPTRWFQITSLILAPLVVLGLFKKEKVITVVLVVYFIFTSGLVFEMTKQTRANIYNAPYSIALSGQRVDITALATKEDINVVEWAYLNKSGLLLADLHGFFLLEEKWGKEGNIGVIPKDLVKIPVGTKVFLRTWNNTYHEFTFWEGIGSRQTFTYYDLEFVRFQMRCQVIYKEGLSQIWEVIR